MIENTAQFDPDSAANHLPDSGEWDLFLEDSEYGHYQQSSDWAEFKKSRGWLEHRYVHERSGAIEGGFQMLWKQTRLGTLCYVSKGPVIKSKDVPLLPDLIEIAVKVASGKRFPLLIVQLPDRCIGLEALLSKYKFIQMRSGAIINATATTNLEHSLEDIRANLRQTTRKHIRQALRRGVTIHEGSKADLDLFFDLMLQTCIRQKARPKPADRESLYRLWDIFSKNKKIRLTIANDGKHDVAGLLCVGFGKRLTIWKKGSNSDYLTNHAMSLLYWEAMEWGKDAGYKIADFASMDRHIALKLLAGKQLSVSEKMTRDWFNLGFGILPEVLPPAYIWAQNPLFRLSAKIMDTLNRFTII